MWVPRGRSFTWFTYESHCLTPMMCCLQATEMICEVSVTCMNNSDSGSLSHFLRNSYHGNSVLRFGWWEYTYSNLIFFTSKQWMSPTRLASFQWTIFVHLSLVSLVLSLSDMVFLITSKILSGQLRKVSAPPLRLLMGVGFWDKDLLRFANSNNDKQTKEQKTKSKPLKLKERKTKQ